MKADPIHGTERGHLCLAADSTFHERPPLIELPSPAHTLTPARVRRNGTALRQGGPCQRQVNACGRGDASPPSGVDFQIGYVQKYPEYPRMAIQMSMMNTAALILFSFLLAGGQLLFKRAAQGIVGLPIRLLLPGLATNPAMIAAVLLYGGSTVLWVWILSRVPLSQAYPWVALGTIIVPLAATLLFGEVVKPVFWLGAVMVGAGIVITQIGSNG